MLEVGDAEVVLHQEEARHQGVGLLPGGVLPQGEAPHLAEVHLQGGAPHQEEDLLLAGTRAAVTEAPGGEAEVAGMDRHQDVDRHQGEALLQGVMDLLVMMAPLTGAATALLETTVLLLQGNRMIGLHPSPLASLTRAGPRWPSVNLKWFTFGPVSCF